MPIIIIYGIDQKTADLETLGSNLIDAVAGIPELNLSFDDVSVFFPCDATSLTSASSEIIAIVEGLFIRPERTPAVRQRLAEVVGENIVAWAEESLAEGSLLRNAEKVEVLVKRFDQDSDGFFARQLAAKSSD